MLIIYLLNKKAHYVTYNYYNKYLLNCCFADLCSLEGEMKQEFNDLEYEILKELLGLCENYSVFVFDDLLIRGNNVEITKRFIKEKPNKEFRVWLIDAGLVMEEL